MNLVNFEGFTVKRFPENADFHSQETGMDLFPGYPGTGMDALDLIKLKQFRDNRH